MAEAKKQVKRDFHASLTKVLKELEGKPFNYTEKLKVKFSEDFAGHKKDAEVELGKLTGLAYVDMGVCKKA